MKKYRFLELCHSSQIKAVYDYIIGWEETPEKDDLNFNEVFDILMDNNEEDRFLEDGTHLEEEY